MARIVAGVAGGRTIAVPRGRGTRPTAERTREALFSSLDRWVELRGARVLDLYAGSGAIGLEAASRGAEHVLSVESDRAALEVLRANVTTVALAGVEVSPVPVERLCVGPPARGPYDIVFADPPYALESAALSDVVRQLERHGWLAADAVVVLERSSRDQPWIWPAPLVALRERRYGEGTLWYGRRS
jgi:16S rRNA (guanine966-N2)-methyltransferase